MYYKTEELMSYFLYIFSNSDLTQSRESFPPTARQEDKHTHTCARFNLKKKEKGMNIKYGFKFLDLFDS